MIATNFIEKIIFLQLKSMGEHFAQQLSFANLPLFVIRFIKIQSICVDGEDEPGDASICSEQGDVRWSDGQLLDVLPQTSHGARSTGRPVEPHAQLSKSKNMAGDLDKIKGYSS